MDPTAVAFEPTAEDKATAAVAAEREAEEAEAAEKEQQQLEADLGNLSKNRRINEQCFLFDGLEYFANANSNTINANTINAYDNILRVFCKEQ